MSIYTERFQKYPYSYTPYVFKYADIQNNNAQTPNANNTQPQNVTSGEIKADDLINRLYGHYKDNQGAYNAAGIGLGAFGLSKAAGGSGLLALLLALAAGGGYWLYNNRDKLVNLLAQAKGILTDPSVHMTREEAQALLSRLKAGEKPEDIERKSKDIITDSALAVAPNNKDWARRQTMNLAGDVYNERGGLDLRGDVISSIFGGESSFEKALKEHAMAYGVMPTPEGYKFTDNTLLTSKDPTDENRYIEGYFDGTNLSDADKKLYNDTYKRLEKELIPEELLKQKAYLEGKLQSGKDPVSGRELTQDELNSVRQSLYGGTDKDGNPIQGLYSDIQAEWNKHPAIQDYLTGRITNTHDNLSGYPYLQELNLGKRQTWSDRMKEYNDNPMVEKKYTDGYDETGKNLVWKSVKEPLYKKDGLSDTERRHQAMLKTMIRRYNTQYGDENAYYSDLIKNPTRVKNFVERYQDWAKPENRKKYYEEKKYNSPEYQKLQSEGQLSESEQKVLDEYDTKIEALNKTINSNTFKKNDALNRGWINTTLKNDVYNKALDTFNEKIDNKEDGYEARVREGIKKQFKPLDLSQVANQITKPDLGRYWYLTRGLDLPKGSDGAPVGAAVNAKQYELAKKKYRDGMGKLINKNPGPLIPGLE